MLQKPGIREPVATRVFRESVYGGPVEPTRRPDTGTPSTAPGNAAPALPRRIRNVPSVGDPARRRRGQHDRAQRRGVS